MATLRDRQLLLERLQAEKTRRRRGATARFAKYLKDPVGFVRDVLLGFVWSKQREIMESVRDNRRTAVPSCHDVGKTYTGAATTAWWLSVHPLGDAFVVTLAPSAPQVKALLWREINKMHAAGGLPGHTNLTEWYIGDELVAFGRSPDPRNPTTAQGVHAHYVLVILDEACGISASIVEAVDTLIANDDCRILAIGNPDDPATEFAAMCRPGSGWNVIRIDAYESPNFTGEDIPEWLKPLLIGRTWVKEKLKKWGESSPLWLSKIRGQFPEQSTDGLVPLSAIQAALDRECPGPQPDDKNELGVDVARFGGDSTVIVHRRGIVGKIVAKDTNRDLMSVAGMVVRAINATGATRVKIDDIGLGGGVTDRLKELQRLQPPELNPAVEIVGVNVAESPSNNKADEKFKNLRAELNWGMRERFINGSIALDGYVDEFDDFCNQAGQVKYLITSAGEIQIEPKDKMKKRTSGVSPDDWDAFVLAYADAKITGTTVRREAVEHIRKRLGVGRLGLRRR